MELYHFGIKGMQWGIRRYQNKDGSLTDLGRKRISDRIRYEKKMHSESRYLEEANRYKKERERIESKGYKKWAKENYYDDLPDSYQKSEFESYIKELKLNEKSSRFFASQTPFLSKSLDSILSRNSDYTQSMRDTRTYVTDWINKSVSESLKQK